MNNKILAARRPSPLDLIWRLTGKHRMPLAYVWVQVDTVKLPPNPAAVSSDETGGRRPCA
jgi:hypothetical protein